MLLFEIDDPPDRAEVDRRLTSVETEVVGLEQGLREVAGRLEGARQGREQHVSAHGRAGEAARQAQIDLDGLAAELALAEREWPTVVLEQGLAEAAAELDGRRLVLAELRARAAGGNLELVEIERARVERAIERRREDVGDLREKVAALQSGIDRDEGAGLEERIEDVIRRLGLRARERLACEREIKALGLLHRSDAAERAGKERSATGRRRSARSERSVPGCRSQGRQVVRITAVRRGATGEEPFEQLRRYPRADRRARPPRVRRDARGPGPARGRGPGRCRAFSDDRRLEQMFSILHHARNACRSVYLP